MRITRELAALGYAHATASFIATSSPRTSCSTDGEALVADFGIAQAVTAAADGSPDRRGVGTPAYMSPEQA